MDFVIHQSRWSGGSGPVFDDDKRKELTRELRIFQRANVVFYTSSILTLAVGSVVGGKAAELTELI